MYIPKEIASNFGHAETLGEGDLNTVKGRISDFSTVSILKILSQLRAGPKTFGNLYTHSGIRFKRSYIKYLHLCIKYGFLDREEQSPRVYYSITSKGRTYAISFIFISAIICPIESGPTRPAPTKPANIIGSFGISPLISTTSAAGYSLFNNNG